MSLLTMKYLHDCARRISISIHQFWEYKTQSDSGELDSFETSDFNLCRIVQSPGLFTGKLQMNIEICSLACLSILLINLHPNSEQHDSEQEMTQFSEAFANKIQVLYTISRECQGCFPPPIHARCISSPVTFDLP